jgi:alginate O-acetyltransferase complex protein AlgI
MLFNSLSFLAFFGAVAVAYYGLPHRFRWPLLLVASLYFYATFSPAYVVLLIGVTAITYAGGLALAATPDGRARKGILAGGIVRVVAALLFFKYYDFFIGSAGALLPGLEVWRERTLFPAFPRMDLVLAVGLSFYTFSCVSYLADVFKGQLPAERHFGHFALYVSFFPKLLAGPIERAKPFLQQIREPVSFSAAGVTLGLQLMLWGLFKKVVIADHLAGFVDGAYGQAAFASPADLVIATYFFAFQLYCDFSGYSDMAIGASKILGIDLMTNFRRPYLSSSTQEFWARRWHLSLASWFRDYLYIPLGGSRVSRVRQHANVMIVFLISGLWHGANWTFVVWGGLNGVYHVVSEITRSARERVSSLARIPAAVANGWSIVVTFHLILLSWVFFRAPSIADAMLILSRVGESAATLPGLLQARVLSAEVLYSIALILVLLAVEVLDERKPIWEWLAPRPVYVRWGVYYAVILALIVLGTWQLQNFVYMQF